MCWKVLRGLGFGAISFTGVQTFMDWVKNYAFTNLGSIPAEWLEVLGMLQIDVCINILISAYIIRAVLWGMNKSGTKSVFRWMG